VKKQRPYVLSIAGFDPSGGAGVLADIKTFEQLGVYGFGVTTAITFQTDSMFKGLEWLDKKSIKKQLYPLLKNYKIKFVKIGLIRDLKLLEELLELLKAYNKKIKIIWDPVLKASAGYDFHKKISRKHLPHIFKAVDMITPNWEEIVALSGEEDPVKGAIKISEWCNVYLKGGHSVETPATDMLWINKHLDILHPETITELEKHGTGCILSSAIVANLALGHGWRRSCELAKTYTLRILLSNETNLGYHV
jgi:hydroxymethylpyrimidine/phosphomethylpyrimidine kinase